MIVLGSRGPGPRAQPGAGVGQRGPDPARLLPGGHPPARQPGAGPQRGRGRRRRHRRSLATLEFAYRQASLRGLPLTVFHCFWDVLAERRDARARRRPAATLEEEKLLVAESIAGMAEKYPDVQVRTELARGLADQA